MIVYLWNKKDKINGVEAQKVIETHNIQEDQEVFLVASNNRVLEIQFVEIIRNAYDMPDDYDGITVAEEYLRRIEEDKKKRQIEKEQYITDHERINQLEQSLATTEYALMMGGLL